MRICFTDFNSGRSIETEHLSIFSKLFDTYFIYGFAIFCTYVT